MVHDLRVVVGTRGDDLHDVVGLGCGARIREVLLREEILSCRDMPVLDEGLLELVDGGPCQAQVRVDPHVSRMGRAEVLVAHVLAACEGHLSVDHRDLAVVAEIDLASPAPPCAPRQQRHEERHVHTRLP